MKGGRLGREMGNVIKKRDRVCIRGTRVVETRDVL